MNFTAGPSPAVAAAARSSAERIARGAPATAFAHRMRIDTQAELGDEPAAGGWTCCLRHSRPQDAEARRG
jgi:hypothetical protein